MELACFQIFIIMNIAAVNIYVQVFVWIHAFVPVNIKDHLQVMRKK